MALFLLFESASGYSLFERIQTAEVADQNEKVQQAFSDPSLLKKMVKLKAFLPFTSAENALENCNDVSEGVLNPTLKTFLQTTFPDVKPSKGSKFSLGVLEDKLGSAIQEATGIKCEKSGIATELLRAIRQNFTKFVTELDNGGLDKAQLGLGHSYSRAKVKFNVNRVDNMIIQSIAILDQLDKDINTFSMRCREWYSWHFPELSKIVADQKSFARLVKVIKNKADLNEDHLQALTEITGDPEKSNEILEAARASMGTDINEIDMVNIDKFADRVIEMSEYREKLHGYLIKKMNDVAPNLAALVGEQVAARLISHAGSLTNLAKMPASTVQILGAEKALFRALKTRGNTPKYGLIYHSSFIGRAGQKNKGRISRYLANKCTIASRIDNFLETSTTKFGEVMKEQVEERLKFYESGVTPRKNVDVMKEVLEEVKKDGLIKEKEEKKKSKKDKKRKQTEEPEQPAPVPEAEGKKKKKKSKEPETMEVEPVEEVAPAKREHKKKKNKGGQ